MIREGDKVRKKSGYKYPGIVVSKFLKLDHKTTRYVVECTADEVEGILHVFREDQLEKVEEAEISTEEVVEKYDDPENSFPPEGDE